MKWAFNGKNDVERFQRSIIHYKSETTITKKKYVFVYIT